MAKRRRSAEYLATLVYLDEPHVILLQAGKSKVIAVAIEDAGEYPFFGALISDADWNRYVREIVDLRYLFIYSRFQSLFKFDLGSLENNKVLMSPWDSVNIPEAYLPSPRFFSRDHTEPLPTKHISISEQVFAIDGSWDLPDFSHFYARYSDIYAFKISLETIANDNDNFIKRRKIVDAFNKYPWQGGSSYMHFYKDLYKAQDEQDRLGVKSLQYASPGHVKITGKKSIFDSIKAEIIYYGKHHLKINSAYNSLYKFLSRSKLLTLNGKLIEKDSEIAKQIRIRTIVLAYHMRLGEIRSIFDLCENNPLVAAKVVMSYFRRIDTSFNFFAEGRVEFRDISEIKDVEIARAKP